MPYTVSGRTLSNGDFVVGAGLLISLIAIFLPWYSSTFTCAGLPPQECFGGISVSVSGLSYWTGWLFFIAVLVGIALYIVRFLPQVRMPELPQTDAVLMMGIGAFLLLMAILWLVLGGGTVYNGPGYSAGPGFGLWLGIVGAVVLIAGGYLKRNDVQPVTRPWGGGAAAGAPPPPPPVS